MQKLPLSALAAIFTLLISSCAGNTKEPPPTDLDEGVYRDALRTLASDEFLGRKPGTPGQEKTVNYLIEHFRKLGLKPGNAGTYLQQVPLTEITAAADATLSVSGHGGARNLVYGRDAVILSKHAVPRVVVAHSELVFVGYGIVAPEYSWDDYNGVDVHGKTVVVLVGDPGYASKDPSVFRGNSMSGYGRWAYKIEEAGRQGAAGVLLIHDAQVQGYGWNAVQSSFMGAQFELTAQVAASGAQFQGWLAQDAARQLFVDAKLDLQALSASAAHAGFKAVSLGATVDAALHNAIRPVLSSNVIATLPGGQKSHEVVVYVAHWDSLGVDPAQTGHTVFSGAVDNASGAAGLVALAQSFVRTTPTADRTIVFLATTAATPDLLGSKFYAENPVFPLRQTAAVIDVDTLLAGGPTRDVSIIGFGNSDLEDIAHNEALLQGRETRPEPSPQLGWYFNSDSYSFARHGVPVLYAKGGADVSARGPVWGQAQIDDYFAHRYRQTSDQYSEDMDVRGALSDLTLYYHVGNRLARSHRFARWYTNSEFRVHSHAPLPPND